MSDLLIFLLLFLAKRGADLRPQLPRWYAPDVSYSLGDKKCGSTQCAKLKFNRHKIDTLWYGNFGNYLLQCVNFSTNQSLVFISASKDTELTTVSIPILFLSPCDEKVTQCVNYYIVLAINNWHTVTILNTFLSQLGSL